MQARAVPRRRLLQGGLSAGLAAAVAQPRAAAQGAARPVTLRFLDTSESLSGRFMLDGFAAARPDLVESIALRRDHVEVLSTELRRSVEAGSPMVDIVLTGTDGVLIGAEAGLWQPMASLVQMRTQPMETLLVPLASMLRGTVRDQAQVVLASPGGPLLAYAPGRVGRVPRTAEELLDWARQNPGRFLYPRPDLTEAGTCFVAGLPYMLGDVDPADPEDGWPATWAYLAELDRHVAYYPTTGLAAQQELAEGGADMIATTIGFDIFGRANGLLPPDTAVLALQDLHWVPVGLFLAVPRGLPPETVQVAAEAIAFVLDEPYQRAAFWHGTMWPGPVRRGVTLEQAPPEMQAELRRIVRPTTPAMIAGNHVAAPLLLEETLTMLQRWDVDISAWHGVRP
jgi:putative spermidine/putrescine transport system substrate-binding protein